MHCLISHNQMLLVQLTDLLSGPKGQEFHTLSTGLSTIGDHIRHILDHYDLFLDWVQSSLPIGAVLDYDQRCRATDVASQAVAAQEKIKSIQQVLQGLTSQDLTQTVLVKCSTAVEGDVITTQSTLGRELQFLHSHTVHHIALIAMIARHHNRELPCDLGVAPSTLKNLQQEQSQQKKCVA